MLSAYSFPSIPAMLFAVFGIGRPEKLIEHVLKLVGRDVVELGHQLRARLAALFRLQLVHRIEDAPRRKSRGSMREIKAQIQKFKKDRAAALEAKDARLAEICKRRISRLKKKTRRAA